MMQKPTPRSFDPYTDYATAKAAYLEHCKVRQKVRYVETERIVEVPVEVIVERVAAPVDPVSEHTASVPPDLADLLLVPENGQLVLESVERTADRLYSRYREVKNFEEYYRSHGDTAAAMPYIKAAERLQSAIKFNAGRSVEVING